jgi:hypothetical protein
MVIERRGYSAVCKKTAVPQSSIGNAINIHGAVNMKICAYNAIVLIPSISCVIRPVADAVKVRVIVDGDVACNINGF